MGRNAPVKPWHDSMGPRNDKVRKGIRKWHIKKAADQLIIIAIQPEEGLELRKAVCRKSCRAI